MSEREFLLVGIHQIQGVRRVEVDGRPQLMLDVTDENGKPLSYELTREMARDLWRALGPHPLVKEFFTGGEGLQ